MTSRVFSILRLMNLRPRSLMKPTPLFLFSLITINPTGVLSLLITLTNSSKASLTSLKDRPSEWIFPDMKIKSPTWMAPTASDGELLHQHLSQCKNHLQISLTSPPWTASHLQPPPPLPLKKMVTTLKRIPHLLLPWFSISQSTRMLISKKGRM